ncbi:Non-specific serine/threonine protein kinase [Purpureocillium takamizusanense]|uniref:Non-specific serine/threonine protein kinase n=1 Tax=Purpureocillium takamizusanense TaxID=2060973 RepID=A0A9Q8Q862_9HYPO|nr:Non-specific serine/threonine protein kinase [Purpureocillium takamizusanense]UNI14800.1 Non-specific serine/threonine protein kinase [Purpureocillium takamizusanense]
MKDIIIHGRYRVNRRIGEGGFGLVYAGTDTELDEHVAIKLMHVKDDPGTLETEARTYKALSGGTGIPRVLWYGQEGDYYCLVHDLLGPSLEDLLNYCDRRFSLKTVLLLADQAISRIKYIHDKKRLHGDSKPDNFLMGTGRQGNVLYTIDFGLARDLPNADHHGALGGRSFAGTTRYASLNCHNGREYSWSDDLESLGYVLLYLSKGSLPWQGLNAPTNKQKDDLIKERKAAISVASLCDGLPGEFAIYMEYTRSLELNERPDYAYLRQLFRRLFAARGFTYDNVFDWTERRFRELHNQPSEKAVQTLLTTSRTATSGHSRRSVRGIQSRKRRHISKLSR